MIVSKRKYILGFLERLLLILLFPLAISITLFEVFYIIFYRWLMKGIPVYEKYKTVLEKYYF